MGQFVSRVHNKQDNKLYNILPMGDTPTVVFGRVIREHSVPGMMYYFADGQVKYLVHQGKGYLATIPIVDRDDEALPCIFTVPEDLDFARMDDVEYVKQYSRSAIKLNANTASPDFIIREGEIICVKKNINQHVRVRYFKNKKYKRRSGNRYITSCEQKQFLPNKSFHSRNITVFPVSPRRPSALSIYGYDFTQRFKARGDYNFHACVYDKNDNICYFRAAKIPKNYGYVMFRCSQFENLDDGWQDNFDFDGTLKYNDTLILGRSITLPIEGETYKLYNERTDNDIEIHVTSVIGEGNISKHWEYYQNN